MNPASLLTWLPDRWLNRFTLAPTDLLRDATYRRLWTSILISSFGGQVTLLALPLTAAVLMHASPTQMGLLTAMEIVPFVLFSLPTGVWLDGVRKLPVYVVGELSMGFAVATVPVAWWFDRLTMHWLYVVAFLIGTVNTSAGSAAQIVLTQIVPRERLVEAHAKNSLATSAAEVAGPGAAGALIKLTGAPLALLADAFLLLISASILRGVPVRENPNAHRPAFWAAMREGLNFRARPSAVGDHGHLRRHLADVQPGGHGGADPVRHAPTRTYRARRGIELCHARRRYRARQRQRTPRGAASGSGAHAGARIRHLGFRVAAAECCPA